MRLLVIAATVVAMGVFAATAAASGSGTNGVHVDPGSPSQHQYGFPISSARAETGAGKHSSSHLFGSGITPSSGHSGSAGGNSQNAAANSDKAHRGSGPTYTLASANRASAPAAAQDPSNNGGSGWLPLAGGGALVLLVGGGGLALRRRLLRP